MKSQTNSTSWPNQNQELLLKAALLTDRSAVEAWRKWAAQEDFDNLEYASVRLIPLLYQNLSNLGVKEPILARYKGVYKKFWFQNQLLFGRIQKILPQLHQAGIQTMLFKGAGLVTGLQLSPGLRPMDDIDILVPVSSRN